MLVQSQKGIVHLGLLVILLLGLVAGVYLVQHPQIFRPKAAGGKVWLIDNSGNNLPQKDGGVYEVPSQQIRIFIHQPTVWSPPGSSSRPQSRLPNLVTKAYAQQSGQCGNTWNNQPTQCADSSGKTAGGTQCSGSYLGSYTGCSGNTLYCYSCPGTTAPSGASSGTICVTNSFSGQPTQCADSSGKTSTGAQCSTYLGTYTGCSGNTLYCYTGCGQAASSGGNATTDVSIPKITDSVTWGAGNTIGIPGQDFGSGGTVYYRSGSQQTAFPKDQVSWSSSSIRVNTDRIPECTAAKTVDCLIKGGYVKVCRTDSKCSDFAQIPDRTIESGSPQGAVRIPTAPQERGAPAAPTPPAVTEVTAEIRISSVESYVKKDGVCEGNDDPAKHCMRLTVDNPDSRYTFAALLTKGYVDWLLANTTEAQNVYVGFISNKGQNFVESIKVRIVRPQPSAQPAGQGGPTRPSLLEAASNLTCIDGQAFYDYPQKGADAPAVPGYSCSCNTDSKVVLSALGTEDLGVDTGITTKSSCVPKPTPTPQGVPTPSPSPAPSASPTPPAPSPTPSVALPITGKMKIIANGQRYEQIYVGYYVDANIPPWDMYDAVITDIPYSLPTNKNQEISYRTPPTTAEVFLEAKVSKIYGTAGYRYAAETDCPESAVSAKVISGSKLCKVKPGSTQNLTVTLTTPPSRVSSGPLLGSPENPDPGMIYVKNNQDQQVTVQKVEQLTSDPTFSLWFWQFGAGYTQLNSQPISIEPKKYVSFEAIVVACSRSDMESSKEKVVKVEYIKATAPYIARGKYQCGGSGIVNIP